MSKEAGGTASFADLPSSGRAPKWEDSVKMFQYPESKWVAIRLVGKLVPTVVHWLKTKNNVPFGIMCHNYNFKTFKFDKKVCPCCKLGIKWGRTAYCNAIIRKIQDAGKNPIRVIKLPQSVLIKIKEIIQLNKDIEPQDPKKGYNLDILNNPSGDPISKYNVQRGDKVPLTDEEKELKLYELAEIVKPLPIEEMEIALERNGYMGTKDDEDDEDKVDSDDDDDEDSDDDDDDKPKKSKKGKKDDDEDEEDDDDEPKKKSKKSKKDDDDDEDEEDDADDEDADDWDDDDDEDDKPKKSKKSKDEDEEDEEDDEDEDSDDEEEDDEPKKKGKKSKKDDEDEDEDSDDEEEDEDDDKPKKGKKSKKDDDDDEDEEDEDDDDDKPKKKGKKSKKDDDDDDDWDLDDDD